MKKYLLGIFAIAAAIAMSAFTAPNPQNRFNQVWFVYNGGGENTPGSYSYDPSQTQACFNSTSDLCQVLADPSDPNDPENSLPVISTITVRAKRN